MTGLSTPIAQDPDHVTLIKKDVKLKTKPKPKTNNINLQSFFTYHFINFSVLHQKRTLTHLFSSFIVVEHCLTKYGPSYNLKKGLFSFLEVLKNILWSEVRLELIKVNKAAPWNMELQCSCFRAGLQLSVGLEAVERMPPLTRHFE